MKTPCFLPLLLLLSCVSCSHYYYAVNELHLARVSEARDLKISGAATSQSKIYASDRITHVGISATASPFRHLALAFNHTSVIGTTRGAKNVLPHGEGHLTDLAVGTYYQFTKPGSHLDGLFDFYAGYAWGEAFNSYENGSSSRVRFQRPYAQFGLHLSHQDVISLGVGLRFAKLGYDEIIFSPATEDQSAPPELFYLRTNTPTRLVDWGLRLQIGPRHAKTFVAFTTSDAHTAPELLYLDKVFSLGILLEVDEFFRKSPKN